MQLNLISSQQLKNCRRLYTKFGTALPYLLLTGVAVLTRFDSLSTDAGAWDEATFMLMAQDILRGHLPYVFMFDNKPPGLFFIIAATQLVLGKSLLAVRILSGISVLFSSFICYKIAKKFTNTTYALLGSIFVILINSLNFGQELQSEQIASFFILCALYCMVNFNFKMQNLLIGLFISLAVLCRSNLIICAMATGVILLYFSLRKPKKQIGNNIILYILGGMTPVAILLYIYFTNKSLWYLKLAMIDVPSHYASERSFIQLFVTNIHQAVIQAIISPGIFLLFIVISFLGLIISFIDFSKSKMSLSDRNIFIYNTMFISSIAVSIIIGGAFYNHYWLQLVPFLSIYISYAFDRLSAFRISKYLPVIVTVISTAFALNAHAIKSLDVLFHLDTYESRYPLKRAANFISCASNVNDRVWAVQGHLVYWYLNITPISPVATHPTNLVRQSIVNTLESAHYVSDNELERVMNSKPRFIIQAAKNIPFYLGGFGQSYALWRDRNYDLWKSDPDFKIFVMRRSLNELTSSQSLKMCGS
ncbi:MAG: glycosyltransferase family 39 protein [Sphingomonadaceae bacterium]